MIPKELEAKILRCYSVEKWPVGTISRQLGVHHDVVERVISQSDLVVVKDRRRSSMLDPYMLFIAMTLEKYPSLPASRLFEMTKERGYPGGPDHFRHMIARVRPPKPAEAYLRLRTLPGEQAQIDWANFGRLEIGRALRQLMGFVMVLSWSRKVFLQFFLNQRMGSFLRGHVEAFDRFGGCPRVCLYDNLKSAVLERKGDAIRFHPTMLELSAHYRFEPRPVAQYRGNEKGRVERAIRYIRHSFFAARRFSDLDDLNGQATEWCEGAASDRPCPEDRSVSVREAFKQEQPKLLKLPNDPFPADDRVEVKVGKTPYVRFDLNDYSVPHELARRTLVVLAGEKTIRIVDGNQVVAVHERSYDKGVRVENRDHIVGLEQQKRNARQHRGLDRLTQAVPISAELMSRLAERGIQLGSSTAALLRLLDTYGARELEKAITEAIQSGGHHPRSVRLILDRNARARGVVPPVPVALPDDPRIRNLTVRPHDLNQYDTYRQEDEDES